MGGIKISKPLSAVMVKGYWKDQYTSHSESYYSDKGQAQGYWIGSLTARFGLHGGVTQEQFDRLVDGQDPNTGEQLIKWRNQGGTKPAWVTDDTAWKEKVEDLYLQALELGKNPLAPQERMDLDAEVGTLSRNWEGITDATRWIAEITAHAAPNLREELVSDLSAHLGLLQQEKAKASDNVNEHRAAYDFTIAPHKSITAAALVGDDKRLIAAHEASVRKVMQAAEEYTQARTSSHSASNTENLIAAAFTHITARPVGGVPDPHLHTHVVVFNMTDDNGKIRAVQPLEWYRIQRFLDAVYQAEMAVRVQEFGYTLERNVDTHSAAIAGYSKEYLASISRRRTEIQERTEELGMYGAKVEDIIAHQGRERKVDWSAEEVQEYHREKAKQVGLDPDSIPAAARLAPHRSIEPEGAEAAVLYAKHSLIERNAVFDHYELAEQALRYGLGSLRLYDVEHTLKFHQPEFVEVHHYRAEAPGHRYTTPEMLQLEREVMELTAAGKRAVTPIAPEITRDQFREEYRDKLNNQQMRLAYNVLKCPDRILAIQGGAGVGKTTVLDPTRQIIEEHGFDVYGVAPTSRAASELAEAGIVNSQTIQRFLASDAAPDAKPRVIFLDESSLASTVQVRALFSRLRAEDRVILSGDIRQHQSVEAGRIFEQLQMSGISTFYLNKIMRQQDSPELLAAVKCFSKGDVYGGLELLDEQNRIREYPSQRNRYAALAEQFAESPENSIAVSPDNDSREGLNAVVRAKLKEQGVVEAEGKSIPILRGRQDLTAEAKQYAFSYQAQDVVRFAKRNKTFGVQSGDYATVEAIDRDANTLTVTIAGKDERPSHTFTYSPAEVRGVQVYTQEQRELAVGDRIQFTQPWRAHRIDNRDFAEITYLDEHGNARVTLDKKGYRQVSFNLKEMPHLDYGYVVTSYSIQGSAKDNVLLNIATQDTRIKAMVDKVFANVSVSRAKVACTVFCDSKEDLGPTLDRLHLKPKAHSREQIAEYAVEHTA